MDVALALALLSAAAPGALSALPVADVSAPPEATSATALMSPFLRHHQAGVVVLGQVQWTNAFLRGLPQEAPRVVLTQQSYYDESDSVTVQVQLRHHVLVVVADGPETLTLSTKTASQSVARFHRALFWTSVATSAPEVVANKSFLRGVTQSRHCGGQTLLALTAADGATTLYALAPPDCPNDGEAPARELDRWAPEEQRWLSGAPPFSKFCDKWLPPASKEPFTLYVSGKWGTGDRNFDLLAHDIKQYNKLNKNITKTAVNLHELQALVAKVRQCRLDGYLVLLHADVPSSDDLTCFFESMATPIVVVVPANLGPAVNPLDAVLVEFSPAVWLGTALAALSTAAALACALRRDRGAALLLALSPLLAQAPGGPPPLAGRALRPLLGLWLLLCVVLVAAYQGLLLGKLSTARSHTEINTLRDLEDSGLPVHAQWAAVSYLDRMLPDNVHRRLVVHRFMNPTDFIGKRVVSDRNCALIVPLSADLTRNIRAWLTPTKSLHFFAIHAFHVRVSGLWSPGSPLGKAIVVAFRRSHEMGLWNYYSALEDFRERLALEKARAALSHARPLTSKQMCPAFLCIIGGHILGAVVLVVELLVSRLTGHEARDKLPLK
ncbi:Ionotropic receptor 149 [Frankliniella occidentalis]|nr:Ionotropic receptor 149 [Frankliniella occidentalis]